MFVLSASALLGGCSSTMQHKAVSSESECDWGFVEFFEVRAYRTNWGQKYSRRGILRTNKRLNRDRLPWTGIPLNDEQTDRLRKAVTGSHPEHSAAFCYYPHHAFVFYDRRGEIVGHIDICFSCSVYMGEPQGFAETWDLKSISSLFGDLGIPIENPLWD